MTVGSNAVANSAIANNNKGSVTLGKNLCNFSQSSVSLFERQVAGMVLRCTMILATCFALAIAKALRESIEYFNWLMSTLLQDKLLESL